MEKSRIWKLFLSTFRIGAFTFGGGYAMIPIIEREFVETRKYIQADEMLDILSIAQSLPGVLSINASVVIGYRAGGVAGALMAALGVTLPSFLIIILVTLCYAWFTTNIYVAAALRGIRAAVVALMLNAVLRMGKPAVRSVWGVVLLAAAAVCSFVLDINAVLIILGGALTGIVIQLVKRRRGA